MKILITGISGYVGKILLPLLLQDKDIELIVGLDITPPDYISDKLAFFKEDVRNPEIVKYFHDIDIVVHLAFIVTEIKNKKLIYDINVNGTKNVLKSLKDSKVRKLVVASSVCAYGSHRDHPKIITENTPLRGNKNSYYSHTKLIVEETLDNFEKENESNIIVTRLRPSILCGANINNFFLDILTYKVLIHTKGNREGLPIVHEDDVAEAFYLAIKKDISGTFNITAENLSVKNISEILNIPSLGISYYILKILVDISYKLGITSFSSHWVVLSRYPVNFSNKKAKEILGWQPKYTSIEAFKEMVSKWKHK